MENSTLKYKLFENLVKEFAEKEVKPLAKEVDEEEKYPLETVRKMGKCGLMGIITPKQYGGMGGDLKMYITAVKTLSAACATTGVVLSAHTSLCTDPIIEFGTEEQKQKYLPKLASGEMIGGFALTEPNAGTDSASQQTTAREDGDYYVLNGNKIFITNAGYADVYVVFAMTNKSLGNKGITAFLLEKNTPGFTVGKVEDKLGIRGSATAELIFTDVRIPKSNVLGAIGQGFAIAMHTLDGGRIGIAAQATGIAEGAIAETIAYVKERKQFGRPLSAFQNTQFQIAEMVTKTKAASLLVFDAAAKKQEELALIGNARAYGPACKATSLAAAQAKLFAATVANDVTREAVQLLGGYGYTRDYPVERMFRDAKITEIYEGTSEVQRMVISGAVLR